MADEQKENAVDNRKEVLDLLKDLQAHYATYHNHKESMAWAGVAFFAVLIAGVATVLRHFVPPCTPSIAGRVSMGVFVVVVMVICWLYLVKQFELRKRAANLVAACIFLRSRLVSDPSTPVQITQWAPPSRTAGDRMQSTEVLPQAVLDGIGELSTPSQESRELLERCAHALVLALAIAMLFAISGAG